MVVYRQHVYGESIAFSPEKTHLLLTMSPAALYLVMTTSSAMVFSFSSVSDIVFRCSRCREKRILIHDHGGNKRGRLLARKGRGRRLLPGTMGEGGKEEGEERIPLSRREKLLSGGKKEKGIPIATYRSPDVCLGSVSVWWISSHSFHFSFLLEESTPGIAISPPRNVKSEAPRRTNSSRISRGVREARHTSY